MNTQRIELLDYARGIALIAMTIFHFGFDLELFGLREPGYISQPHWKYFARVIASSFLFLAGFSLYIAHASEIKWSSWRIRMIKIVAAAILMTVATFFATPDQYIFFGILHAIAFASVAGLLFFNLPWFLIMMIAIAVFTTRYYEGLEILNAPLWFWTGLQQTIPNSSDYVPVFPWFSAPLMGIAFAKLAMQSNWLVILSKPQLNDRLSKLVKFLGRNSLVYYLLHQPVMIGILLASLWLTGNLHFG